MIENIKSYSNPVVYVARISAASLAVIILTSCSERNGRLQSVPAYDPAGTYREYLSEIRKSDDLSFEELALRLKEWQTVRDSVFAHIRQDTTRQVHTDTRKTCILLHDSICAEFSRLVLSQPRTYKELLALKERLSPYDADEELHRSAEQIRPFFAALDNRPPCRGDRTRILSKYRTLLSETIRKGIHGCDDLTEFIEKEDAVFLVFLTHLHELGEADLSGVTRDTEKCCSEVFLAAERQEITYKEAMIYMAMRTNRRLIQNVRTCLDDINRGQVTTPRQAYAYIWMILQSYVSLDGFCMTLLSAGDKAALDRIAAETPGAFDALHKILSSETGRLDELPAMLMEIFIASM